VTGDRAAVEWWAVSEAKEPGPIVTLAGASLIRFGADGLVREQYDYWNEQEGAARGAGGLRSLVEEI
jgi:hypothetical protein